MIQLAPIGFVHSSRTAPTDDRWDEEKSWIELDSSRFSPESLAGLQDFSHVEVIFFMDQVEPQKIELLARHPRNRPDWPKVGIFAQRGKNRPNQLGLSVCRLLKVEGLRIDLEGLDAIKGTPVLDLKPWVEEFGPRGSTFQPSWISELMRDYWRKD